MKTEELTWREHEILELLAKRLTNREIADQLHLAESTVKEYVSRVLAKLFVSNRRQAVAAATRLGLLSSRSQPLSEQTDTIPAFATPLIGRVAELERIKGLIAENTRLLTLLGPGGIGKTRLAAQAAEDCAAGFEHGAVFVSLTSLKSSNRIVQTIAEALNFPLPTYEDETRQLLRFLRTKKLLLILDNFEHLLNDGLSIVELILQSARNVQILITSRERLEIEGEVAVQVTGLGYPADTLEADLLAYDAVGLFVQCARRIRPEFPSSEADLNGTATICRIVQGMPLALELAASWLHMLTVDELKQEIEQSIDILGRGDARRADERHASIRAVFAHSWSMLDSDERELFTAVTIFRDGFTREAAEHVTSAKLHVLSRLVSKSMIRFESEESRFRIHELLRQYGNETLALNQSRLLAIQQRHAAYYADFMAKKWDRLRGSNQLEAVQELGADLANIRGAWQHWAEGANAHQMSKFFNGLWLFYWLHGWNLAGYHLFRQAGAALSSAQDEAASRVRAHAMANQAFFMAWLGQAQAGYEQALASISQVKAYPDSIEMYFAYHGLTLPAYYLGQLDEEKRANDEMQRIALSLGDPWLLAFAEFVSAVALLRSGLDAEPEQLALASLKRSESMDDFVVRALALNALGHIYNARGESSRAKASFVRSLQIASVLEFQWAIGNTAKYLGRLAISANELDEAEHYLRQSLGIASELGLERDIANHLIEFARLRAAQGRVGEAISILELCQTLPVVSQARLGEGQINDRLQHLLHEYGGTISARPSSDTMANEWDLQTLVATLLR